MGRYAVLHHSRRKKRDIFIFQSVIGCRVSDLWAMIKANVMNGFVEYKDLPGQQLHPFTSQQQYNCDIKTMFEKAGITYLVTKLDSVTRTESKVPINEMASSHMARSTFIGNIYKLVKDPNLVSALTGHAEGSRAFNRYRDIDIDMKRDLVKILEGKR